MNVADILLVLILAGAFLVGFFQGVVRGLLAVAAWLVAFLLGANLWGPVGDYLASQWTSLDGGYVHMLAFGLATVFFFGVFLTLIFFGAKGPRGFTSYVLLDDLLGGVIGVVLALIIVASSTIILGTFYGLSSPGTATDVEWSAQLYRGLTGSTIGALIGDTIVPLMGTIFGALVPQNIREAMA
jgi:uncharacterized membrane protein required for colicin V production